LFEQAKRGEKQTAMGTGDQLKATSSCRRRGKQMMPGRVAQKNIRAEQVKANKTDLYTYIPCTGYLFPTLLVLHIYIFMPSSEMLSLVIRSVTKKKTSWERFSQAFHLPLP